MSATSRTKSSSFLSYWKEHKIKKMGTDIAYALFTNSVLHYLCHISYARHLCSYPFSNIRTFSKTAKGAKHFISKKRLYTIHPILRLDISVGRKRKKGHHRLQQTYEKSALWSNRNNKIKQDFANRKLQQIWNIHPAMKSALHR